MVYTFVKVYFFIKMLMTSFLLCATLNWDVKSQQEGSLGPFFSQSIPVSLYGQKFTSVNKSQLMYDVKLKDKVIILYIGNFRSWEILELGNFGENNTCKVC